ncbi:MAG: tRNA pseudouridine(13) synthase TruD, partial [Phycisphaerales bacterium]|nr:tRNA pseudouridine(13) synthase TruD [Phycisphaerales bacterium]
EDFLVEEIPLYEPEGEGEHIYLFVEKKNLSTFDLIDIVARHFGVKRRDVGYAGLKDKAAITRQVVSIHTPGRTPEDFPMLQHPLVSVLWTDLHRNKLRLGHLRGNRFSIRIRNVSLDRVLDAQRVMKILHTRGVPNFFGPQRFGLSRSNHVLGRALVLDQPLELARALFRHDASPNVRAAYEAGDFQKALQICETWREPERCILQQLVRANATELDETLARRGVREMSSRGTRFWNSALQSAIFNEVLSRRLAAGTFDVVQPGDLAFKHVNGAVFRVGDGDEDAADLRHRLDTMEISPTGPLWGPKMMRPEREVEQLEIEALAAHDLTPEQIDGRRADGWKVLDGARRPLRIPLTDPEIEAGADEHGVYVRLAFDLPRGCYATTVLREVMKVDAAGSAEESEG